MKYYHSSVASATRKSYIVILQVLTTDLAEMKMIQVFAP
jgi:hypothetical protein